MTTGHPLVTLAPPFTMVRQNHVCSLANNKYTKQVKMASDLVFNTQHQATKLEMISSIWKETVQVYFVGRKENEYYRKKCNDNDTDTKIASAKTRKHTKQKFTLNSW